LSHKWGCATDEDTKYDTQIAAINAKLDKLIGNDNSLLTTADKINPKFMQSGHIRTPSGTSLVTIEFSTEFDNQPIVLLVPTWGDTAQVNAHLTGVINSQFTVVGANPNSLAAGVDVSWIAIDTSYAFN
jgi:hypothetical protein